MFNDRLVEELRGVVGSGRILTSPEDLIVYENDGLKILRGKPYAVVLPNSTEEVSRIVKLCDRAKVPFIPRGAGTSLSGGANPAEGGVIIAFSKMDRILSVDTQNRYAVVEAGLVNAWLSRAVSRDGLHFAPDPSSQMACTIGGNVAHNAGGPHTLKYGVTTNHVLGLEVVLPNGEVVQLGGTTLDTIGYDLVGVMVGSDGTLGIITKAIVKLTPIPEGVKTFFASFKSMEDASSAVSSVIASGIIPAAIEMMDKLSISAIEASIHAAGYPLDAGAVLLIEIDGLKEGLDAQADQVIKLCKDQRALEVRIAKDEHERKKMWAGRKGAFGAMGRISPDYYVQDSVIPRTKLPIILRKVAEVAQKYHLKIANVFHAGDGNLHPLILFDSRIEGHTEKAVRAGEEIAEECVKLGGSITGEHGIGIEKRDLMPLIFSPEDLEVMDSLRSVFNPENLCNPGKMFPTKGSCGEPGRQAGVASGW